MSVSFEIFCFHSICSFSEHSKPNGEEDTFNAILLIHGIRIPILIYIKKPYLLCSGPVGTRGTPFNPL